ncbi:MAG TPA: response regulator [Thermodesulfobacteriota bacterium]|nr:response regulator [Thermodesulfobacteriota bacterium]
MNLCVNARDAMPDGGKLSIFIENIFIDENYARMTAGAGVGPYVVVGFSNTGIGIPPDNVGRIFEPFFITKEYGKGTGLGLAIVFGIIKGHGGFIKVYSEVGKGTKFMVYLPASRSNESSKADEDNIQAPSGNGELILVVDDEASICEITNMTLERYNYSAVTARDGREALAIFNRYKEEVRAVIVDNMMPVMDGAETIGKLRKINPAVKIVSASGFDEKDKYSWAGNSDAQVYLWKPFTAKALLKVLHEVLREAKKA